MGMREFDRAQLTTESTVVVRNPPSSLNMGVEVVLRVNGRAPAVFAGHPVFKSN
jgi:hypothetical protein